MTGIPTRLPRLRPDDPVARALVEAIHAGDLGRLEALLAGDPGLASARLEDGMGGARTPLHVATDWPGHFPNGVAVVRALIERGADPDAPCEGWHTETPLHWA
ncbi:MAG: ankyrin repeat domain-containing protein, partial [Actinomycetota bacterium]